jgi:hypothetical protein
MDNVDQVTTADFTSIKQEVLVHDLDDFRLILEDDSDVEVIQQQPAAAQIVVEDPMIRKVFRKRRQKGRRLLQLQQKVKLAMMILATTKQKNELVKISVQLLRDNFNTQHELQTRSQFIRDELIKLNEEFRLTNDGMVKKVNGLKDKLVSLAEENAFQYKELKLVRVMLTDEEISQLQTIDQAEMKQEEPEAKDEPLY